MVSTMNTVLLFAIVLGGLIFFHELGHFLVARLFGVGVEKFSLGFGPRILGKTIGRTDYRLSLIPLGGYVKMVGDEPDSELAPEDIPFSFTHQHVLKRGLIVAAGPLFNALLAVIIFVSILYFIGISSIRPVIRNIDSGSPAEQAGIRINDLILEIDQKPIVSWRDIIDILDRNEGGPLEFLIKRDGETLPIRVVPQKAFYKDVYGDEVAYSDIGISGMAEPLAVIGAVSKNLPAFEAGLKKGDKIMAIDDRPIQYWREIQEIVTGSKGKALTFDILRGEERLKFTITPELVKDRNLAGISSKNYRIGIARPEVIPEADKITLKQGLIASFQQSFKIIGNVTLTFFDFLKKVFQGKVSRELVGGPIRIAQMAQQSAQMGLVELLSFVASISLQLAILNLLPIPVLDGGHLLFFSIEAVLRRPVNKRMRETAQQVGLFILLLLMIFVVYNDIDLTWIE
jgi:regulator of sigma E protease